VLMLSAFEELNSVEIATVLGLRSRACGRGCSGREI